MSPKVEYIGGRNLKIDLGIPFIKETYKLKAGIYEEGAILQLNESTNQLEPLAAAGVPHSILSKDYKNETEVFNAVVYLTGTFNMKELIVPEGKTPQEYKEKLRELYIYIR